MDEIIIVAICLFLNGLFAAYEMAFVSVPRSTLRSVARQGNQRARRLVALRESPERTLSILQIGITLVGAIAAAVGGAGAAENIEPYLIQSFGLQELAAEVLAVILVVLPITYLSVVVGELVPKSLALRSPMRIVLGGARALFIADRILSPIVTVLEWSTKKILSTIFPKSKVREPSSQHTIEIEAFSPVHQSFILNMVEIEQKRVSDILIPWAQVNIVQDSDSLEDVTQVVLRSGHTRLPVMDKKGGLVGILHTKEFVALKESGEQNWLSIIHPALKVLPTDTALGVLRLMQEKRSHMTIVLSETLEILGVVTMEDIIEEIVGDIYDEDDDGRVRKIFASRAKSRKPPTY